MIRAFLLGSRLFVFGLLLSVAGTAAAQPGPEELRLAKDAVVYEHMTAIPEQAAAFSLLWLPHP